MKNFNLNNGKRTFKIKNKKVKVKVRLKNIIL